MSDYLGDTDYLRERHFSARRIDIAHLLAQDPVPVPWRCRGFVADGTVTMLTGRGGDGKSWLTLALAAGVSRGMHAGGIECTRGNAMILDAEMGGRMMAERFRVARIGADEIACYDGMGLDLADPRDRSWLQCEVEANDANLLIVDSLRRLTPRSEENSSGEMATVVAALARMSRETNVAVVLVHHMGRGDNLSRGSTAIQDQADALFGLIRDEDDPEQRKLVCRGKGKMRYAVEPPDRHLMICPEDGGVTEIPKTSEYGWL